jgi:hypothetical protein
VISFPCHPSVRPFDSYFDLAAFRHDQLLAHI